MANAMPDAQFLEGGMGEAARGLLREFNPNHDDRGRFTDDGGGLATTTHAAGQWLTSAVTEPGQLRGDDSPDQPRDDHGRWTAGGASLEIGPRTLDPDHPSYYPDADVASAQRALDDALKRSPGLVTGAGGVRQLGGVEFATHALGEGAGRSPGSLPTSARPRTPSRRGRSAYRRRMPAPLRSVPETVFIASPTASTSPSAGPLRAYAVSDWSGTRVN
jgi:hypothetical protein